MSESGEGLLGRLADERSWPFQVARQFFDALAKTLAQRADAMLRA